MRFTFHIILIILNKHCYIQKMKCRDLFSISFHQGELDLPHNLKIKASQINKDNPQKYA